VSEVLPANALIAMGRPTSSVNNPYSICLTPRFLSAELAIALCDDGGLARA
jgi:hypothetical protein